MRRDRRDRLLALHRWTGLVGGWLLFAVFLWGTLSVYDTEITLWMEPEIRTTDATPEQGAAVAERVLAARAPSAAWWRVDLPSARSPVVALSWCGGQGGCGAISADGGTGRIVRRTAGGDLFFALHYGLLLGAPGEIAVGFAGLVLLLLIGSGILVHAPRLLPDLFTLRLHGAAARAWRDGHTLTAVAALPFLAVFAYSGVMVFGFLTLPATVSSRYGQDASRYFADLDRTVPISAGRSDRPGRGSGSLETAVRSADRFFGQDRAGWIFVSRRGAGPARTVRVTEQDGTVLALRRRTVVVNGGDGRIIAASAPDRGAPVRAASLLYGIHFARWGGRSIRLLYAASGAIGTASIAAGLALFGASRRARRTGGGLPISDRVTLAATLGLVDSCLAPFWANRILPSDLTWRARGETSSLLLLWLAALAVALVRRHPARPLLVAGVVLGTGLAPLDLATATVTSQPWLHAALDGTAGAVGLAMLAVLLLGPAPAGR